MAGSVNKVILVGRLGKDPEIKMTQNGGKLCNFSIATSETWRDSASGERKEKTEWHRIVVYNERLVEILEKYVRKGQQIYLEGQLQSRTYVDNNNQERSITEVVLPRFRGEITIISNSNMSNSNENYQQNNNYAQNDFKENNTQKNNTSNNNTSNSNGFELDDEVPF